MRVYPSRMAEPEYEEHDAKVIVMRDPDTGAMIGAEANAENIAQAHDAAARRKAIFEHRVTGASARAGRLPRTLIAALAAGTTNLMLQKILQEELVPATAKEAADIAKITNTIFREQSGQTAGNKNLTPQERAAKEAEVDALSATLAARAKEAGEQLAGAVPDGEPVPTAEPEEPVNQWDHGEQ